MQGGKNHSAEFVCYFLLRGGNAQLAGVHCHKSSICMACGEEQEKGSAKKKDDPAWGCHMQGTLIPTV